MAIKLPKDSEAEAIKSLIRFFREEREEELSEIQARFLLDFFVAEVGPSIFNLAVQEAQSFMERAVSDVASTCYEQEFSFRFRSK